MNDDKIFRKLEKLLNLSKSSNEYEAALALQRAQKLMQEHNIDVKSIAMSKMGEHTTDQVVKAQYVEAWVNNLAWLVATTFGVKWFKTYTPSREYNKNGKSTITFYGNKQRAELAIYCYEVLSKQILKARREYTKTLPSYLKDKWKWSDSFCLGWVQAVESKVKALSIDEEEELLIEEYKTKNLPAIHSFTPPKGDLKVSALWDGYDDGQNAELHAGVSGQETVKIGMGA
jgi:hypothetical protein